MTEETPKPKKPLTEAQLRQRRQAADKSTGPRTEAGKAASSRNAWKTGEHSAAARLIRENWAVGVFAKPCKTTCRQYPCSLVDDGITQPGGDCLDKTVYVRAFDSLMASLESGTVDPMHGVLAAEAAGALELLQKLREEIAVHGLVRELPVLDKEGKVVTITDPETGKEKPVPGKIVGNPAIAPYIALLDRLGLNLPELLATPRAVAKVEGDEAAADAVGELLGRVASMDLSRGRRPLTIDQPDD